MVRFVALITALATLGVAAGASFPYSKAQVDADQGLHGRRTSSYYKKVYCDSYDCPYGYDLVDDADEVKCKNYKCTKDQCCEKDYVYCDSYDCPDHYDHVHDSDDIKCKDHKCTKDQCCEKDYDYCDSYYCPKHYNLKDDADDIKCSYSGCTTDKCCDYH